MTRKEINVYRRKPKGLKEHRYVMEQHLNRELSIFEIVHHIDGNKKNNNINNLKVMTRQEHNSLHGGNNKYNKDRGIL